MYQSQAPRLISGYGPIRRPRGDGDLVELVKRLLDDQKRLAEVIADLCRALKRDMDMSAAPKYDYLLTDGTRADVVIFIGACIDGQRCQLAVLLRTESHHSVVCYVEHYSVADARLNSFMNQFNQALRAVIGATV
jgi:hypothetical protein